jgi:cytochrome c
MPRRHKISGAVVLSVMAMLTARSIQASWAVTGLQAGKPKASSTGARRYTYTLPNGKKLTLDFPLFVEGNDHKVTKDVFHGYQLYNSYCYRCHGTDVTESELAPNLRHTFEKGLTRQQFLAIVTTGRDDKGMPKWGGFLTEEEMTSIYRYVKGRSLELVPVGRPPSEFD